MRKSKRLLMAGVAVLSMGAIVGTAFSAWFFSEVKYNKDTVNTVTVNKAIVAEGEIVTSQLSLTLNQKEVSGTSNSHGITLTDDASELATGVTKANNTLYANWYTMKSSYDSITDASNSDYPLHIYVNIYLKTDTLAKYIAPTANTLDSGSSSAPTAIVIDSSTDMRNVTSYTKRAGYTLYQYDVTKENTANWTAATANKTIGSNTYDYEVTVCLAPDFDYFSTTSGNYVAKPTTLAQYKTMVATLNGKNADVNSGNALTSSQDSLVIGGKDYETPKADMIVEYVVYDTSAGEKS